MERAGCPARTPLRAAVEAPNRSNKCTRRRRSSNTSCCAQIRYCTPPAATAARSRSQREPFVHSSLTAANRVVQYIGSTERISERLWVYDVGQGMVERDCEYVPGLYKIFDEILVNAADNKQRDASMDTIKVDIDVESGTISVMNNGAAVPVQMHTTEQVYVPELIFGHLLTGSNFDDDETKVTGGRNGFGAKLANIFSVGPSTGAPALMQCASIVHCIDGG
jgi:hypothetical protein